MAMVYTKPLPTIVSKLLVVLPIDVNMESNGLVFGVDGFTKTSFKITARRVVGNPNDKSWFRFLALGVA